MDVKTMTRSVTEAAELDEPRARAAIDSVLGTLAERIGGDEARHLADQLPVELQGPVVEAAARSPEGTRFGLDEFVERVARQLDTERAEGERLAAAVLHTLGEQVDRGEWADVLAQLPTTMDPLFSGDRPSDHNG